MTTMTMTMTTSRKDKVKTNMEYAKLQFKRNKFIYLLLMPSIICVLVFSYLPLWGIRLAFLDYNIYMPEQSTWIGLDNFKAIFASKDCIRAIINTFRLSILGLIIGFPLSIIFALLLNELKNLYFKRFVQTVSYLPHFLSWISVIGIAATLLAKSGMVNDLLMFLNPDGKRVMFLAEQKMFEPMVLFLSIWKGMGWGSIVFLAAITGVDHSLYEAADIDGANSWNKLWRITFPEIMPTIVIMLLWRIAALFGDNFELIYGLQNAYVDYEVIGTYIYKNGIEGGNYQLTTAFGLAQGLINLTLLLGANWFARETTETSLF